MSLELDSRVTYIKGVGPKMETLFNKLGIFTVEDLLSFYPRSYVDLGDIRTIAQAAGVNDYSYVRARVSVPPKTSYIRKGMTLFKLSAVDGENVLHITVFNNKYLAQSLREGEEYIFHGKVVYSSQYRTYDMSLMSVHGIDLSDKIMPVYPQTAGLNSKKIYKTVKTVIGLSEEFEDIIPQSIKEKYSLCSKKYAVRNIHCPHTLEDVEVARKRLIFEELLVLQLGMAKLKSRDRGRAEFIVKKDYTDEFFASLPYTLTNAQKNAVYDAVRDMGCREPMNRLLQGDVGSGKTAVAAALIYNSVKNGMQCALMAPTGILASQHYGTFTRFFDNMGITVTLLTGNTPKKEKDIIKAGLKEGSIDVLIGTHSVIQDDVEFARLGFVVTDEQHRFGVRQRTALFNKGIYPHVLVMSATPIPRTLSLMIYGDLDLSVLNEFPPGRQKIDTYFVDDSYRQRVYEYIKKHLRRGLQGYIVCPLVEDSEAMDDLTGAKEYFNSLQTGEFKDFRLGLLHGKMKGKEKEQVMADFLSGKIQLLVSTTVVEVGVDVPNAVIMLIENAERFGLSTLHQLRGRVGRGSEKSTCILISSSDSENAVQRLKIMEKTSDGFVIADEDLKMRGPGDFFGNRQHGLPEVKIADLLEDRALLSMAGSAAKEIYKSDPLFEKPENKKLRIEIQKLFNGVGNLN